MKIKFLRKGVFTTAGKTKLDGIQDLPDEEANMYMQKGLATPAEDMVSVSQYEHDDPKAENSSDHDHEETESEDITEEDDLEPPEQDGD